MVNKKASRCKEEGGDGERFHNNSEERFHKNSESMIHLNANVQRKHL